MHIIGITGSLRKASCNTGLLRVAQKYLASTEHTFDLIVPDLPLYNGDYEATKTVPQSVLDFQNRVSKGNAILFATPEYNYSMSGVMKNAIDWGSRKAGGNAFAKRPAAVLGGGGGVGSVRAQNHFRDSAVYVDMHVMNHPHILFRIFDQPSVFDLATGDLKDGASEEQVHVFMKAFLDWSTRIDRAMRQ